MDGCVTGSIANSRYHAPAAFDDAQAMHGSEE